VNPPGAPYGRAVPTKHPLQHMELHGHDLAFRVAGSGPVIVLVHGMAGSSETWRYVMPALAERFTVVAPDLPGHGESAKPRGDYSLGAFASTLRDLLVGLGHERATFVGQSLGGGVVMQFAYQFPERCERLVLVSSGGLGEDVNLLLRALSLPGAEYVLPIACTTWMRDTGLRTTSWLRHVGLRPSRHLVEIWNSYGSLADTETRTAFLQTLRAVVDLGGQRVSAANRLYLAADLPTLIVWGDRDRIIPVDHAHTTHDAIPGSRLEIFDGAGHFPHCEQPGRFVDVLSEFMTSTKPAKFAPGKLTEQLRRTTAISSGRSAG
jgi:pimeloyl-ACP methyl ester carboxylesterase